ncbi:hypothetical protein AXF42_Ash004608 [Apostasia shenzhenica]|uniref:Uncharacterized protein n=1 Tax=Apostasia shenzhenica TaxID=1088818 RepID=A0A2I0BH45_9ASPA|nr:hypothetical protein AXF42_Ash004608 [Apostasia shenzhenica]
MASKLGLAGGIPERRVRPIWDAVDSRQFKTALKLSAALLAKYPNSPYALALKALILERTGKLDEALSVCLEAKELLQSNDLSIIHIDDLTLSTLQIVFQRLGRLDLATSCYEHACGKFINNLEIMMGLFNCYVREYSFVKQQQIAIKMYKIVAEERFLLWAICSIQLQVLCSKGGEKLLSLAEALLKKHVASHSLHEPEALTMYISILEQQAKYGDALEVLSGNFGSLIGIEADKFRMQGRLFARACNYAAAAEVYRKVLHSCPDDWVSFLNYLGCLLENDFNRSANSFNQICHSNGIDLQGCKSTKLLKEVFDSRMSEALCFMQNLKMEVNDDRVRCPYLATIEIERQCCLRGKADEMLMQAILDYFQRFGHLSCFVSDIELFLSSLTANEKAELLEKFVGISESSSSGTLKKLGQVVTIFKLKELFGFIFTVPVEELEASAKKMVVVYCENLVLSKDLDHQENMYGEELLPMASNALVLLFWRTGYLGYLLEAVLVLEFGLNIRKYTWQYKLPLLHLYSYLRALPLAYEWYGTLDVKNILLETTSHHIVPHLLASPLLPEASAVLKDYLKFMDEHLKEAADLTFLAYRHRNYSKVIEFVQFKERLEHSNQYAFARIEFSILQLKQKADNFEEVECILEKLNNGTQLIQLSDEEKLNSVTFNEDFQLRPWWSPNPHVNYLSEPFEEVSTYLHGKLVKHQADEHEGIVRKVIQRKSLIPRLIYLSIHSASTVLKETVEQNGSDATNNSELRNLLETYARNMGLTFDDAVKLIYGISKGRKSLKDISSGMMLDCMNFAVFLNAWNFFSHHPLLQQDGQCPLSCHMVDDLVKACTLEKSMCEWQFFEGPGSNFSILVQLITEPFTWHALIIQSCVRSMVPSGKKKKKSGPGEQLNLQQVPLLQSSIDCLICAIQRTHRWLGDQSSTPEDRRLDVLSSQLLETEQERGPGHILRILEENASSGHSELGERISGALQLWNSADVLRKLVSSQESYVSKFKDICESKLKWLESLKRSF